MPLGERKHWNYTQDEAYEAGVNDVLAELKIAAERYDDGDLVEEDVLAALKHKGILK